MCTQWNDRLSRGQFSSCKCVISSQCRFTSSWCVFSLIYSFVLRTRVQGLQCMQSDFMHTAHNGWVNVEEMLKFLVLVTVILTCVVHNASFFMILMHQGRHITVIIINYILLLHQCRIVHIHLTMHCRNNSIHLVSSWLVFLFCAEFALLSSVSKAPDVWVFLIMGQYDHNHYCCRYASVSKAEGIKVVVQSNIKITECVDIDFSSRYHS